MNEQKIKFETAKLAKEKGFNDPHSDYYITKDKEGIWNDLSSVPQSVLQKWLRDAHKILVVPIYSYNDNPHYSVHIEIIEKMGEDEDSVLISGIDFEPMLFESYEDSLEKGLVEALKLI